MTIFKTFFSSLHTYIYITLIFCTIALYLHNSFLKTLKKECDTRILEINNRIEFLRFESDKRQSKIDISLENANINLKKYFATIYIQKKYIEEVNKILNETNSQ